MYASILTLSMSLLELSNRCVKHLLSSSLCMSNPFLKNSIMYALVGPMVSIPNGTRSFSEKELSLERAEEERVVMNLLSRLLELLSPDTSSL